MPVQSGEMTRTELMDRLCVSDGLACVLGGVEVARCAGRKAVRLQCRHTMPVEPPSPIHQLRGDGEIVWKQLEELVRDVAPRLLVKLLKQGLDRLLGGLLDGKARLFEVLVVACIPGMRQVTLRLTPPV